VYAIVLGALPTGTLTIPAVGAAPVGVRLLGSPAPIGWTSVGGDLTLTLPADAPVQPASVFALSTQ
jgi:hypothetical protein